MKLVYPDDQSLDSNNADDIEETTITPVQIKYEEDGQDNDSHPNQVNIEEDDQDNNYDDDKSCNATGSNIDACKDKDEDRDTTHEYAIDNTDK